MKKLLLLSSLIFISLLSYSDEGMYTWKSHIAYGVVTQVADAGDIIYALAGNALFQIDKATEEMTCFSKQDGFHGSNIIHIAYDSKYNTLLVVYEDGLIDFVSNGQISALSDLQNKQMNTSKKANSVRIYKDKAYLGMPFGIVVINMAKKEIADTYYIGLEGKEVDIKNMTMDADSIYAITANSIYSANLKSNLLDYNEWTISNVLPDDSIYQDIIVFNNQLYTIANNHIHYRSSTGWHRLESNNVFIGMKLSDSRLFLIQQELGVTECKKNNNLISHTSPYLVFDVVYSDNNYWLAANTDGLVRQAGTDTQVFIPEGPIVNIPYRMKVVNNRLYVVSGGRWATQNRYAGHLMIYDISKDKWKNIYSWYIENKMQGLSLDFMNVAVDPFDVNHYFVTSYGTGLFEFINDEPIMQYTHLNSPLTTAAPGNSEMYYIRTDGAMFDKDGNLWVLNMGDKFLHIATPTDIRNARNTGQANWNVYSLYINNTLFPVYTSGEIFIDGRYDNWKWIPYVRYQPGLILYDDNGTPLDDSDDNTYFQSSFFDQDGKEITFTLINAIAQDKKNDIWVAIDKGLFIIPHTIDFRKSNLCERVKIPRNDGSNLADYLLDTERISAICIDGANRKWIGTESSGLYLISEDGLETIEHFTTENSPLPSNKILSLAIDSATGRVFVGTDGGLMSYQNDAAEPEPEFKNEKVYAYPNPVKSDFNGVITITGLMDNTEVKIVDNGGNLVCSTISNGGLAVWDGKTISGKRVTTGVYTAFCNAADGKHTVVKILVIN